MTLKISKKYIDDFRKGYIIGYVKGIGRSLTDKEMSELKNRLKDDAKVIELIKRKK